MPLKTLHTRLFDLLNEARFVRQAALQTSEQMAAGPISANAVVGLAQRLQASVANVILPEESAQDLADYADLQFGTQFHLLQQLAGAKALIAAVIAECRNAIPSHEGYILKDLWNQDGSVSVRQLTSQDTVAIRAALQNLAASIPE